MYDPERGLEIETSSRGGVVMYHGEVEFSAGGKNGKRKCEAFYGLATYGRIRETKRVACATGLSFKAGEDAVDIFRDINKESK